ncbi:MAG: AEC family transporter [Tindallia sp. MSAO_Bac2]|nr:MAG: AEC family transporter [Tindallia sp. MSAO_Bac2]
MDQAFISVVSQIMVLFFIMLTGFVARKASALDQSTIKGMSSLLMNVSLPALVISAMQFPFDSEVLSSSIQIIIISICAYIGIISFSYIYKKTSKEKAKRKDVIQFALIFSNVTFMGFPVVNVIYGEMGVFFAALYNMPFNLVLLTLGVAIMSRSSREGSGQEMNLRKALLSPGIIALIFGFSFFVFSIRLPGPLYQAVEMLGSTTTPLAMLIIGALLGEVSLKSILGDRSLYLLTFNRLLLMPLLAYIPLRLLGFDGMMLGIPVIIIAMPVGAVTGAFASMYDADDYLASKAVFITTILSMITIPLWATFL